MNTKSRLLTTAALLTAFLGAVPGCGEADTQPVDIEPENKKIIHTASSLKDAMNIPWERYDDCSGFYVIADTEADKKYLFTIDDNMRRASPSRNFALIDEIDGGNLFVDDLISDAKTVVSDNKDLQDVLGSFVVVYFDQGPTGLLDENVDIIEVPGAGLTVTIDRSYTKDIEITDGRGYRVLGGSVDPTPEPEHTPKEPTPGLEANPK